MERMVTEFPAADGLGAGGAPTSTAGACCSGSRKQRLGAAFLHCWIQYALAAANDVNAKQLHVEQASSRAITQDTDGGRVPDFELIVRKSYPACVLKDNGFGSNMTNPNCRGHHAHAFKVCVLRCSVFGLVSRLIHLIRNCHGRAYPVLHSAARLYRKRGRLSPPRPIMCIGGIESV